MHQGISLGEALVIAAKLAQKKVGLGPKDWEHPSKFLLSGAEAFVTPESSRRRVAANITDVLWLRSVQQHALKSLQSHLPRPQSVIFLCYDDQEDEQPGVLRPNQFLEVLRLLRVGNGRVQVQLLVDPIDPVKHVFDFCVLFRLHNLRKVSGVGINSDRLCKELEHFEIC